MASDDDKKTVDLVEHIARTTLYSREQARNMLSMARGAGLPLGVTMDLISRGYGEIDLATAAALATRTLEGYGLGGGS